MKLTNINNTVNNTDQSFFSCRQREVEIVEPISTSLQWHQLSRWRSAEKLRAQYPELWADWKKKNVIPEAVVLRVELGQSSTTKPFADF